MNWNIITDEMRNDCCANNEKFPRLNELVLLNVGDKGIILGYLLADKIGEHGWEYSWYDNWDNNKIASIEDPKVKAWRYTDISPDTIWRRYINGI